MVEVILVIGGILLIGFLSVKGENQERKKVEHVVSGKGLSSFKPEFWAELPTWVGYLIGILLVVLIIIAIIKALIGFSI